MRATRLQVWLWSVLDALEDAREELDPASYEALLDIVATRIARDYVRCLSNVESDQERAA